jgi:hypothetical protein
MHLSFPDLDLPSITLPWRTHARGLERVPRLSKFWIAVPLAAVAVAVSGGILMAKKPIAVEKAAQWTPAAMHTEYVSSDPSVPAASTVKFPEDYSEPVPTF